MNPDLVSVLKDSLGNSWLSLNADTSIYIGTSQANSKEGLPNETIIKWEGSELISGINYGKYIGNYKYGFYEIRCKIPDSSFTSFWLSVKNGIIHYKEFPEIDVFETVWDLSGNNPPNTPLFTSQCYAWKDPDNRNGKYEAFKGIPITPDFYNSIHKKACLWTPDYADIYIDSLKMGRINYKMGTQFKISLSREISSHTMIENRFNDILEPFLIDYIYVYQYIGDSNSPDGNFPDPKRWATSWSNRNDECFNGNWKPREIDKFFSGNFNSLNSNKDELLIFRNDNSPDSVILMDDYITGKVSLANLNHTLWINERNNDYIHNWHIDINYILNILSLKSGIYFLSCDYANNSKTFKIVKSN